MSVKKKTKIVAVVNQKGGVGKTTTVINLATSLAAIGQKTLICDVDPQGNASTGIGVTQNSRESGIYDVFCEREKISNVIVLTEVKNLDIISASVDLAAAEIELVGKAFVLKEAFAQIEDLYDVILIDCPPSLGMITVNALFAANSILIPVQCEFFALEGLSHLMKTYERISSSHKNLSLEGILLTMYDKRNNLTQEVEREVRNVFGDAVYNTTIPRNIKISESPSYGLPVMMYDINCPGSMAYINLAREFVKRNDISVE